MTPETPIPPRDRATLQSDLDFTRERLRELAPRLSRAEAGAKQAAKETEAAKLEADLRPTRAAHDLARHASRLFDIALEERDSLAESIERMQRYEAQLEAALRTVNPS